MAERVAVGTVPSVDALTCAPVSVPSATLAAVIDLSLSLFAVTAPFLIFAAVTAPFLSCFDPTEFLPRLEAA